MTSIAHQYISDDTTLHYYLQKIQNAGRCMYHAYVSWHAIALMRSTSMVPHSMPPFHGTARSSARAFLRKGCTLRSYPKESDVVRILHSQALGYPRSKTWISGEYSVAQQPIYLLRTVVGNFQPSHVVYTRKVFLDLDQAQVSQASSESLPDFETRCYVTSR